MNIVKNIIDKNQFGAGMNLSNSSDVADFTNTDRNDITSMVNSAYKTIDTLALYARQKADSVIDLLSKVSADEMCDFNIKNGVFMMRLMHLNDQEKKITLQALGVDAMYNGDSTAITNSAMSPSYAENINYRTNFINELSVNNSNDSSFVKLNENGDNIGQTSLYYDDNDSGQFDRKISVTNPNSAVYKTKKMFEQHKINTLISRFHSDPNAPKNKLDVTTKYGLSHGRNLLTAKAEKSSAGYSTNGYDNPYCRVWTHHHQYDRLTRLIRPFTENDEKNNPMPISVYSFHQWDNFKTSIEDNYYANGNYNERLTSEQWGWKSDNDAWKYSVMGNNGIVNITPKYINGDDTNIHTKQCMFSIENLAWRDYNPYSFEKALSWEQRGPMGGRIMWFPPYGLSFNENTTAQWQNNTFIGRGEDVYTYANTTRTGSLNFMMVIDHPSIIDYVSRGGHLQDGNKELSDNDMHRFFAGCDEMSSGGKLSDYAKPTPLTDESLEVRETDKQKPELKKSPETKQDNSADIDITFYVFFPNNYAGYYDKPCNEVEAIPYLLYGKGAQMQKDGDLTTNLPLSFNDTFGNDGSGYEMSVAINKVSDNYIIGTNLNWANIKNNGNSYKPNYKKLWYYRIDGEYKVETKDSANRYINCYDQKLTVSDNYADTDCSNLNCNVESVQRAFTDEKENDYLYTLTEIALCLSNNDNIKKIIKGNTYSFISAESDTDVSTSVIRDDKISDLKKIFEGKDNYKLVKISASGFSSSHGNAASADENTKRNEALAQNRASTAIDWLKSCNKNWSDVECTISTSPAQQVSNDDKRNVSGFSAKANRCAKVVMTFSTSSKETLPNADQKPEIPDITEADISTLLFVIRHDLLSKGYTYIPGDELSDRRALYDVLQATIKDCIKELYPVTDEYPDLNNVLIQDDTIANSFRLTYQHISFNDIDDAQFEKLKENIIGNVYSEVLKQFKDEADFDNSLGSQIKETIKKDDAVQKEVKELNKLLSTNSINNSEVNEYNENKKQNLKVIDDLNQSKAKAQETIDINNSLIASYEADKKDKETRKAEIETKLKDKDANLSNDEKDELNNEFNDLKHEIDKLKKQIVTRKDENKHLKSLNDDRDKEINRLERENKKLDEKIDNANKNIKDQYSVTIRFANLNEKQIKNVIFNFLKKESDTDLYYKEDIYNAIKPELEKTQILIFPIAGVVEANVLITMSNTLWSVYNTAIAKYTGENGRQVNITKEKLQSSLNSVYITVNDNIKYEHTEPFMAFTFNDQEGCSSLGFGNEWLQKLIENLNSYSLVGEINWNKFRDLVNEAITQHMYTINVEYDESEAVTTIPNKLKDYKESTDNSEYLHFSKHIDENTQEVYYINDAETDPERKGRRWFLVDGEMTLEYVAKNREKNRATYNPNGEPDTNKLRYDQEYHFFRVLKEKDRMTYEKLMQKIQYFNPAYHSMTPEGFTARLTFLQQCMRQGNTVTASDTGAKSANNLAFGRAPYCVLRLGDFYNQMIVIDNISISYDPLQWDLNDCGVGVIPLLANVSMSFKMIGGSSMYGAVNRLQNAQTFNYYANSNLMDNRSDRPRYKWSENTNGALEDGHDLIKDYSYFYTSATYKKAKE